MIISDQDHRAPTASDALRFFAALDAMDPPDGVSLPDWLAAVTGARAALRDPTPERGDAGAEAMRERRAREAERVLKSAFRYPGGAKSFRLPMAPRSPREIAAAIRALPLATPAQEQVQGEENEADHG